MQVGGALRATERIQHRQLQQQVTELWSVPPFTLGMPAPHICLDPSLSTGFHDTPEQQADSGLTPLHRDGS